MLIEILWTSINAVLPIVLLIALGYLLRRIGVMRDGFIKEGKNLVFKVLMPCSLFVNVYSISNIRDIRWNVLLYTFVMILFSFVKSLFQDI